jgi:multidrug efflux pump subunit AcrA (membrane-fusion protein)
MRKLLSNTGFLGALAVTVVVGAILIFLTWQLASTPVPPSVGDLRDDLEFLSGELATMKERLERLRARQAVLEREADVLRQANRLLREEETARQAEFDALQSELDFYRRLAGTGGAQTGLEVYRAELLATGSDRVFQFVLTLTQNIRRASIISGRARIDVEGTLDDRPVTLYWAQLSDGATAEPAFRFKYFQQLEGYLALPEGFMPNRLVVTLETKGQRSPVQRSYGWATLLRESSEEPKATRRLRLGESSEASGTRGGVR